MGLLFLALCGLIGALLVLFGVWQMGNGLEVEVGPERIRVRRSLFFLPGRVREWATAEIERIEVRVSGQWLRGARTRVEYSVQGVTAEGRRIPLGDGIRGPILLERVVRHLEESTGLPVTEVRGRASADRLRDRAGRGDETGTGS